MYHDRVSRFIKCLHDKKQVEVFQWKKCSDRTYCTRYGCRPLKCVHAFVLPLVYRYSLSDHYMCAYLNTTCVIGRPKFFKFVLNFVSPLVYRNTRSNHYMCDWNSKVVKNADKLEPLHV